MESFPEGSSMGIIFVPHNSTTFLNGLLAVDSVTDNQLWGFREDGIWKAGSLLFSPHTTADNQTAGHLSNSHSLSYVSPDTPAENGYWSLYSTAYVPAGLLDHINTFPLFSPPNMFDC